jgi:hypothetical protein
MNLEQVRYVDDAITSRHSVRAFLNTPVETQLIQDILAVASRAPSVPILSHGKCMSSQVKNVMRWSSAYVRLKLK